MMVHESPLRKRLVGYQQARRPDPQVVAQRPGAAVGEQTEAASIEFVAYGPIDAAPNTACELVATFGDLEAEYAAMRKGAGLLDSPHRATLVVTGEDRRDFLNRMLTQELKDVRQGTVAEAFWLNRKGRIDADLLLIELGPKLLIDLDVQRAAHTVETLRSFVFTEDVEIVDASEAFHHVGIHGPLAGDAIAAASGEPETNARARAVTVAGAEVAAARRDLTGEPGYELIVPREHAEDVWDALLKTDETLGQAKRRVRPVGWFAFNIARIEAGTPLYNIDFGPGNLPHETGILGQRISFTKGCYLGQEVVARIESLGRPKQSLVGLRPARDLLPVAGAPVCAAADGAAGPQIGIVTSSTLSPMLGSAPIAFAMIKFDHTEPGTTVVVSAEGEQTEATVGGLRFYGEAAS